MNNEVKDSNDIDGDGFSKPEFTFRETQPAIHAYDAPPKYMPGDSVYIISPPTVQDVPQLIETAGNFRPGDHVYICSASAGRDGPYLIEEFRGGKYTLCDQYGRQAEEGKQFAESELELAIGVGYSSLSSGNLGIAE